jgi:hypothetical protein
MKSENERNLADENGFDRVSFKKVDHERLLRITGKTGEMN